MADFSISPTLTATPLTRMPTVQPAPDKAAVPSLNLSLNPAGVQALQWLCEAAGGPGKPGDKS
jgi:hypothetical protein